MPSAERANHYVCTRRSVFFVSLCVYEYGYVHVCAPYVSK